MKHSVSVCVCMLCCGNSCFFSFCSSAYSCFLFVSFCLVILYFHFIFSFTFLCTSSHWFGFFFLSKCQCLAFFSWAARQIFGSIATTNRTGSIRLEKFNSIIKLCVHKHMLIFNEKKIVYTVLLWPKLISNVLLTRSHLSTQREWNSWEHGSTRSTWRISKSHMHTTQDVWSPMDTPGKWSSEQLTKLIYFLNKRFWCVCIFDNSLLISIYRYGFLD